MTDQVHPGDVQLVQKYHCRGLVEILDRFHRDGPQIRMVQSLTHIVVQVDGVALAGEQEYRMLADRPVDPNGARTTAHRYSSQFHVWKRYAIHTVEDPGVDRSMTTPTFSPPPASPICSLSTASPLSESGFRRI